MAKKIYQLFLMRFSEAGYQLSQEERDAIIAEQTESFEKAGGKNIVFGDATWSNEEWQYFGVNEYPDIESLQEHTKRLEEIPWFRYVKSKVILGNEMELG